MLTRAGPAPASASHQLPMLEAHAPGLVLDPEQSVLEAVHRSHAALMPGARHRLGRLVLVRLSHTALQLCSKLTGVDGLLLRGRLARPARSPRRRALELGWQRITRCDARTAVDMAQAALPCPYHRTRRRHAAAVHALLTLLLLRLALRLARWVRPVKLVALAVAFLEPSMRRLLASMSLPSFCARFPSAYCSCCAR